MTMMSERIRLFQACRWRQHRSRQLYRCCVHTVFRMLLPPLSLPPRLLPPRHRPRPLTPFLSPTSSQARPRQQRRLVSQIFLRPVMPPLLVVMLGRGCATGPETLGVAERTSMLR